MKRYRNKKNEVISGLSFFPMIIIVMVWILYSYTIAYNPNLTFKWDKIRPDIKDTVLQLDRIGSIAAGGTGYDGRIPQYFYQRLWLLWNASNSELVQLTDYPSGVIRATAYEALIRRKYGNKNKILNKALNDTTSFLNFQCGCIGETKLPIEYLVEDVLYLDENSPPQPVAFYDRLNFSEEELEKIRNIYKHRKAMKWKYLDNHFKKYYNWLE